MWIWLVPDEYPISTRLVPTSTRGAKRSNQIAFAELSIQNARAANLQHAEPNSTYTAGHRYSLHDPGQCNAFLLSTRQYPYCTTQAATSSQDQARNTIYNSPVCTPHKADANLIKTPHNAAVIITQGKADDAPAR